MNGLFLQFKVTTADHWGQTMSHSQSLGALKSTVIIAPTPLLLLLLMLNNNNNNNNNNNSTLCALSQRNIMMQSIDSKCRMCYKAEECIKHSIAGCTTLAPSEYTKRCNNVAGYIHWTICKHKGLQVTVTYYRHT
jgi:hypothetical protein